MKLNQQVIVQSELVPIYNGLGGRVIGSVTDQITGVTQYKILVEYNEENKRILTAVGEPYVNLDKKWEFWFVESELQIA
jgi:hypothetical protein